MAKKRKGSEARIVIKEPWHQGTITMKQARAAVLKICYGTQVWLDEVRRVANKESRKLAKKKKVVEADVQRACREVFETAGWLVRRNNQIPVPGRTFPKSEQGVSDLLCIKPPDGKGVAVEIKSSKEKHEEWLRQDNPNVKSHARAIKQKEYGRQVRMRGGYFFCIYSVEQAVKIVEDLK